MDVEEVLSQLGFEDLLHVVRMLYQLPPELLGRLEFRLWFQQEEVNGGCHTPRETTYTKNFDLIFFVAISVGISLLM